MRQLTAVPGTRALWRECFEWLLSAGVLDSDVRCSKPTDLAAILHDGVVLCHLAMRIRPDSIDPNRVMQSQSYDRESQISCTSNITLFLNACRGHLGIKANQMFHVDDLYDLQNFTKVLQTLVTLSRTPDSRKSGLKPFPHDQSAHPDNGLDVNTCNTREGFEEAKAQYQYNAARQCRKTEARRQEQAYINIVTKPHYVQIDPMSTEYKRFKPKTKRERCIQELLDTETNYCVALKMIVENFHQKLRLVLSPNEHDTIFTNVQEIRSVNEGFHKKLQQAVYTTFGIATDSENGPSPSVSTVFLEHKMSFVCYANYCSLLKAAQEKAVEVERRRDVKDKIAALCKEAKVPTRLQDLLCVPFQRICKYHLMLGSLVECTPSTAPDRKALEAAREAMLDVNDYVNEFTRDQENLDLMKMIKIVDIIEYQAGASKKLTSLDRPIRYFEYGRHLQDEAMKVAFTDVDPGKFQPLYAFLFEKILHITKRQTAGTYEHQRAYLLQDLELLENATGRGLLDCLVANRSLILNKKNVAAGTAQSGIVMQFMSARQYDRWRKALKDAIKNIDPPEARSQGHNIVYATFIRETCSRCNKLLLGKFLQGYRCANCEEIFHRRCAYAKVCTPAKGHASMTKTTVMSHNRVSDASEHSVKASLTSSGVLPYAKPVTTAKQKTALASSKIIDLWNGGSELEQQPWYFGVLSRENAEELLSDSSKGTFLVRESTRGDQYAISLKLSCSRDDVTHAAISQAEEGDYYLYDEVVFATLTDLVRHYRTHSLAEALEEVDAKLTHTPLKCSEYRVMKVYAPDCAADHLAVEPGDIVHVLDTSKEPEGWWKGVVEGRGSGLFPITCLECVLQSDVAVQPRKAAVCITEPNISDNVEEIALVAARFSQLCRPGF